MPASVDVVEPARAIVVAMAEALGIDVPDQASIAEIVVRPREVEITVMSTTPDGRKFVGPLGGAACERFRRPART